MKSTILASVFCAVALSVDASSLGSNSHGKSLFRSHKRHAAALSSSSQHNKFIKKRKTPGGGDVTSQPANLASGSYTAKQGCAIWHTVGEGEVCLGLIDKSSAGFGLDKFLQFNPSLNKACSNLETGKAYCVDTVAASNAAAPKADTPKVEAPAKEVTPAKSLLAGNEKPQADAHTSVGSADDEEDCEEEEDDSKAEDDEDCEDDEEDSADTVITVKTPAAKKVNPPAEQKPQPAQVAPVKEAPQPQAQAPKPTSTYVAPSSTYVAPTSTYVAPKETYSPEPKPEAPKPEAQAPASGGSFDYNNQQATYYLQNGNPGSCGDYNNDGAYIVAISSNFMSSDKCGKMVKLRNTATGKEITAKIADTCPTCEGNAGIDLSQGAFQALAPGGNLGLGVLNIDYTML